MLFCRHCEATCNDSVVSCISERGSYGLGASAHGRTLDGKRLQPMASNTQSAQRHFLDKALLRAVVKGCRNGGVAYVQLLPRCIVTSMRHCRARAANRRRPFLCFEGVGVGASADCRTLHCERLQPRHFLHQALVRPSVTCTRHCRARLVQVAV